jgi:Tfp pilus assembly protein PilF
VALLAAGAAARGGLPDRALLQRARDRAEQAIQTGPRGPAAYRLRAEIEHALGGEEASRGDYAFARSLETRSEFLNEWGQLVRVRPGR